MKTPNPLELGDAESLYITKVETYILIASCGLLVIIAMTNYLLFHTLIELYGVVISTSILIIAVHTHYFAKNKYFMFIGIAFGSIAFIDFVHILTYKGMGVFPKDTTNVATQLWIASRYLESFSLLAITLFSNQLIRVRTQHFALLYILINSVVLSAIFNWGVFPDCYINGIGLTPFKIYSEILIAIIYLAP